MIKKGSENYQFIISPPKQNELINNRGIKMSHVKDRIVFHTTSNGANSRFFIDLELQLVTLNGVRFRRNEILIVIITKNDYSSKGATYK